MDGVAWGVTVHRVLKSWTRLKQLSTHTHTEDKSSKVKIQDHKSPSLLIRLYCSHALWFLIWADGQVPKMPLQKSRRCSQKRQAAGISDQIVNPPKRRARSPLPSTLCPLLLSRFPLKRCICVLRVGRRTVRLLSPAVPECLQCCRTWCWPVGGGCFATRGN